MRYPTVRAFLLVLLPLTCFALSAHADDLDIPDSEEVGTAAIDNALMPPSVETGYQAIVSNESMLSRLDDFVRNQKNLADDEAKKYDAARKSLEENLRALVELRKACPLRPRDVQIRSDYATRLDQGLRALVSWVKGNPGAEWSADLKADLQSLCDKEADPHLLSDDKLKTMLTRLDDMRDQWVKLRQRRIDNAGKLKSARLNLKSRLESEIKALKLSGDKTAILTSDLKWLILILGGLSMSVMLIIRFYEPELQTEWVASGQVIQFMTVLILLIAILILGLAGILKENTLGTLLGGIGGYVLAQGVGRAAARSALRQAPRADAASQPRQQPQPEQKDGRSVG